MAIYFTVRLGAQVNILNVPEERRSEVLRYVRAHLEAMRLPDGLSSGVLLSCDERECFVIRQASEVHRVS